MVTATFQEEVAEGKRFEFGKNWQAFLNSLNDDRIRIARESLQDMLEVDSLKGKTFLDIGSGSGLFSLCARQLGAAVFSLDYDPQSVACTTELRKRYFPNDTQWEITSGSALDTDFITSLGSFDIVYSYGVLHHTGNMHLGFENAAIPVKPGGKLFVAIYNDQGIWSRRWLKIKKLYNKNALGRWFVCATVIPFWIVKDLLVDLTRLTNPFRRYEEYRRKRGMSIVYDWYDWYDWLGGLPFEVAKTEDVFEFFKQRGFQLTKLKTTPSWGNNELVFRRLV